MAGANWYRDGTVTATNGSKDVLGAEERLAEHERNLMEEYGTTYLVVALIDAARGRGAKLAEICGTGGTRAEAIQADLD